MSLSSCCVSSDELLLGHENAQDASSGTSLSQTGERMHRGGVVPQGRDVSGGAMLQGCGIRQEALRTCSAWTARPPRRRLSTPRAMLGSQSQILPGQHVLPGGD